MKTYTVMFDPNRDLVVTPEALSTYAYKNCDVFVLDIFTLIGAIEYADRTTRRSLVSQSREFNIEIPVYDRARWNSLGIEPVLARTLAFLTGDVWNISFTSRHGRIPELPQPKLPLDPGDSLVLPYSGGLDSKAVASILATESSSHLYLVKVSRQSKTRSDSNTKPFSIMPFKLILPKSGRESSARSRAFKFTLIGGLAAYLVGSKKVVMSESGQGIFGPALAPVAQEYPDYRNHPLFTNRMEKLLETMFGTRIQFHYPRMWSTKAETLSAWLGLAPPEHWYRAKSCWYDQRWGSVSNTSRQCGVCAACMYRRMSVFASGHNEPNELYIAENLKAQSLEESLVPGFKHATSAFRQYAIAGTLQQDNLAELATTQVEVIDQHAEMLSLSGLDQQELNRALKDLLRRHASEWQAYLSYLGPDSFISKWLSG